MIPTFAVTKGAFVITSETFKRISVIKRISRFVIIPKSFNSSSTTGTPEILYSPIKASASATVLSGPIKIGSIIIPLSDFLTLVICLACVAISIFLWMIPMPPKCAIAIAALYSVTVSIAAETIGMLSVTRLVRLDFKQTSLGSTSECCGTSSTSSNVNALFLILMLFPFVYLI